MTILYFSPWPLCLHQPVQLDLHLYKLYLLQFCYCFTFTFVFNLIVLLICFHLSVQASLCFLRNKENYSFLFWCCSVARQKPLLHPSVQLLYFGKSNAAFKQRKTLGDTVCLCKGTHQLLEINVSNHLNHPQHRPFNYYSLINVSEVTHTEYLRQSILDKEHGMCVIYREHSVSSKSSSVQYSLKDMILLFYQ